MDKVIVIRHSDQPNNNVTKLTPKDGETNNLEGYFTKYGKHFSPKLLEYALSKLENKDQTNHRFTCQQIKDSIIRLNYDIPSTSTIEDITYTANMAYADFVPDLISEDKCIEYAMLVANDVDGYEGIQFYRWISDQIGKGKIADLVNYM